VAGGGWVRMLHLSNIMNWHSFLFVDF